MKKRISLLLLLIFAAAFTLSSCEKYTTEKIELESWQYTDVNAATCDFGNHLVSGINKSVGEINFINANDEFVTAMREKN